MMDRWHAAPEVWDDQLDALICEQQAKILRTRRYFDFKSQPYFSPSSANADKRELYEKLRGAKRDVQPKPPHQGRWTRLGTAIGGMIQRDLLFIERHYERTFGEAPPFTVERTSEGYPAWEDFATRLHVVEHDGHRFALYGKPDGILRYKDGRRVGLEIKSKQTTASKTGSMREAEGKHVAQTVGYSEMYGTAAEPLDDYLIVYVNAAKKSWAMTEEEYAKSPDLTAFHVTITQDDRMALLDELAGVVRAVKDGTPPKLDLDLWTFNSYKTACALSLTDEEFAEIGGQVRAMLKSRQPEWRKQQYYDAYEFIKALREKGVA
ncbi:hypothetical protein M655_025015 [Brevibacillus sp. NSP2.1]|uniref:hypothetical protein n=1 Tax=Brevibacillus sp. NSP2.1 TaxID=3003229 RepID=UPI0012664900|nr:hypothetical protein [Brevibacillus sp. NSP2.1]QHZ58631.1 hypothetical protein M655_025015 [Brevibacillus sp. NSP2.1]